MTELKVTSDVEYPLSPEGVFRTIQGECGPLLGVPMIFIRLGGCSVGCPGCDTNYTPTTTATLAQIREQVARLAYGAVEWIFLTGGEPTDHDVSPLMFMARDMGLRIAMVTAGVREIKRGFLAHGVDFLSVSPHSPATWVQTCGDTLNVVPGLNGLRLADIAPMLEQHQKNFNQCYVTPFRSPSGQFFNLEECINWVQCRRGWQLGIQAHKTWGIP